MTNGPRVDSELGPRLAPSLSTPNLQSRLWKLFLRCTRLSVTVRAALALAVVNRIALFGVVWLSMRTIPRLHPYKDETPDSLIPGHPLLNGWTRWDAVHYARIAAHGYPRGAGVAFFPGFPLLERAAVTVVGAAPTVQHLAATGILVSNACFVAAVPIMARLTADCFDAEAARAATMLLCLTPFGFFFSAAYTESTFLLLAVAALTLAQTGRWRWAAVVAGLASGTRLFGLALTPALLLAARRRGAPPRTLAVIAFVSPMGAGAFFCYCAWALGDLLAPIHAQQGWGGWNVRVWGYAKLFLHHPYEVLWGDPKNLSIVLNLGAAALVLVALPWVWRRLDPATALFTSLIAVQVVVTWVSLGRYLLPTIGAYMVGGALLARPGWRGWPRDAVIMTSVFAQCGLAILFSHGYWIV